MPSFKVVALRAMAVRWDALRSVGVRVAARAGIAARDLLTDTGVWVLGAVREDVLYVVRADTCLVAGAVVVRDAVEMFVFVRGAVARSRSVCVCLAVAFVTRDTAFVFADVSGVLDFLRVVVTVFVSLRRVAARTASSDSIAHTLPNPSSARHTAKSTLVPFILIYDSVANFRKIEQVKYEIQNMKYDLVRPGGIEPPRILSTASLVLRVYQFRHGRFGCHIFAITNFFFNHFMI